MVGSLGTLGIGSTSAQAAGADYKALVCVFLFGGNDSNNMVVPTTRLRAVRRGAHARRRASALAQAELLQVTDSATGKPFGLHPNLDAAEGALRRGQARDHRQRRHAARADDHGAVQGGTGRPPNLFSHSDQQIAWRA